MLERIIKCAEKAKGLKKHAEKDKNVLKRRNVNYTKVNTMTTIETISWSKTIILKPCLTCIEFKVNMDKTYLEKK